GHSTILTVSGIGRAHYLNLTESGIGDAGTHRDPSPMIHLDPAPRSFAATGSESALGSSAISYTIAFCAETLKPFCQHALDDLARVAAVDPELNSHEFNPGRDLGASAVIGIEQDPLFHGESAHVVDPRHAPRRSAE